MKVPFDSILFPGDAGPYRDDSVEEAFRDVSLDRIVQSVTTGREEYDLASFFGLRPTRLDAVLERQAVMRDVESPAVRAALDSFASGMRTTRQRLPRGAEHYVELERQRWLLSSAEAYADAVEGLREALDGRELVSNGLIRFRSYLCGYVGSEAFRSLRDEGRATAAALASIRYSLLIQDGTITVSHFAGERDYGVQVEETFRRFHQREDQDYAYEPRSLLGMNHVEEQVIDRVAHLNPEPFAQLARLCAQHREFIDPRLARFDREIQFYLAYLEYAQRFRAAGLPFCYPELSRDKVLSVRDGFDLALAEQLLGEKGSVVCNDFWLAGSERVLVVTGPNQGGKTTFARMVGQIHHLAGLGCPVAAREARLLHVDQLFTHFEREEHVADLRGKLEDDLLRIRRILDRATPASLLVINEIFSSTSHDDALFLSREILERIFTRDVICVYVTFLDELAAPHRHTVSLVAGIDARDPALRTFRVERRPADGLAHALALAEKHRVSYRALKERIIECDRS